MVDVSKIKPGDKVTAEVTVSSVENGKVYILACYTSDTFAKLPLYIPDMKIIGHTPAPREIKVGDRVTLKDGCYICEVLAIDDRMAWIKSCWRNRFEWPLADLRHADEAAS